MGRGGPCLNREKAREVVDKLGIHVIQSDGHGILISRPGSGERLLELWRVYTGGGIAGNSDSAWLAPRKSSYGHTTRGPFWKKASLEKALRAWRRGL